MLLLCREGVRNLQANILFFPKEELRSLLEQDDVLALKFAYRLLWLCGNHLRAARIRFISQAFEEERLAIRNLLEQNCTQLSVSSPLHKVPHLLDSIYTGKDAFDCISDVIQNGNTIEKGIANVMSDILIETNKESTFFTSFMSIYLSLLDCIYHINDFKCNCVQAELKKKPQKRKLVVSEEE